MTRRIDVEAFPGGRSGHAYGERCWCKPYRDHLFPTVLVHRKAAVPA